MKRYYVGVKYLSKWGLNAKSRDEALQNGKITLATLIMQGVICIDVTEGESLFPCDVCGSLVTEVELNETETGKSLCPDCSMQQIKICEHVS